MKLAAAWNRYFYEPSDRYQLGILRVLVVLAAATNYYTYVRYVARPEPLGISFSGEIWFPALPLRLLGLGPPPASWVGVLHGLYLLLMALAGIGLFTRVSLLLFALLHLYFEALVNSLGFITHDSSVLAIVILLLACAPGADSCSVDAFVRQRRGGARLELRKILFLNEPVPIWPVRLILICFVSVYLAAGSSKVINSPNLKWFDGHTLSFYLSDEAQLYYYTVKPGTTDAEKFRDGVGLETFTYTPTASGTWITKVFGRPTIGPKLSRHMWLMQLASIFSCAFELSFVLALVSERLRKFLLYLGLVFHISIFWLMHIPFTGYMAIYGVFVDWRALFEQCAQALARRRGSAPAGS